MSQTDPDKENKLRFEKRMKEEAKIPKQKKKEKLKFPEKTRKQKNHEYFQYLQNL